MDLLIKSRLFELEFIHIYMYYVGLTIYVQKKKKKKSSLPYNILFFCWETGEMLYH